MCDTNLSDAKLLERICHQDSDAFEVLYERYQAWVSRHLVSMVRDQHAAADITQEVFLRVWERGVQWSGQGTFKAWLLRIATNQALNYLRTVRRRREQPLELPPDPLSEDEPPLTPAWMVDVATPRPEETVLQRESTHRVQQMIARLPQEKREVFRLVVDAQMEIREVAEALRIPAGTVRSRLHYARKLLAHEWEK